MATKPNPTLPPAVPTTPAWAWARALGMGSPLFRLLLVAQDSKPESQGLGRGGRGEGDCLPVSGVGGLAVCGIGERGAEWRKPASGVGRQSSALCCAGPEFCGARTNREGMCACEWLNIAIGVGPVAYGRGFGGSGGGRDGGGGGRGGE